ncbi:MAG: PilC/PilY family type IV pilus protein [Deltaproteobacteria bacterium]|nr:PilC/PilY family type IV pilus protein [Deltaproteobacteria bacterium]
MKTFNKILMTVFLLLLPALSYSGVIKELPGNFEGVPPNVLIILDNSGSMLCPAYFTKADGTTIYCNGAPGTNAANHDDGYDTSKTYYGYFDSTKQYSYASNKFTIDPSGDWNGNFLNWVSMRRIDVAKKVLVGGKGLPKARPALDAPNSLVGQAATSWWDYIKKYDRTSGVTNKLFPSCGTSTDCYFGLADGYIYLDDDTGPFSSYTNRYTISLSLTTEWESGVVQQVSGSMRLGLEFFNTGNGGRIDQYMDAPPVSISYINAIENIDPTTGTPLGESLYTAAGYFATDATTGNTGPRYYKSSASSYNTSGANSDPFDYPAQNDVSCAQTFILLITDGDPSGDGSLPDTIGDYDKDGNGKQLDDVALWARTTDLRGDIKDTQNITLYTVFAFGGGSDILKDAAVNGGFTDKDNDKLPDPPHPSSWASYTGPFSKNEWDDNADGLPDNYFAAESGGELKRSLIAAFLSIFAKTNTATSPVIMPGTSAGDGNVIYSSEFLPIGSHQWIGRLKKKPLDKDGYLKGTFPNYSTDWDAGVILGNNCTGKCLPAASRTIFTVDNTLFTTSNGSALMPLLGTADLPLTEKLINFVRGIDVYDEDADNNFTEERWKLADIYNSRPMVAAVPPYYYDDALDNNYMKAFKEFSTVAKRTPTIYAGGNDGMLHAFEDLSGKELWAFIPPMILPDLKNMISTIPRISNTQYYVDSSPIIEDVYIGGKWKTIVITGLRFGGRGYFTLDITDPHNPEFLWAVSTDGTSVTHWNSSGTASDVSTYINYSAYTKLGYSWSEPTTARMRIAGTDKWVGVIGGGYRAIKPDVDFDLPDHAQGVGRQFYVIDLENGAIIGRQDETVITDEASDGIDNSIPANVSVSGSPDNYMQYLYAGDREGQIWKVNVSGSKKYGGSTDTDPVLWSSCKIFDANASYADPTATPAPAYADNNRRYIYAQPELSEDSSGNRWIFWGTGNGRDVKSVYPQLSPSREENEGNIFVAMKESMEGDVASPPLGTACGTTLTTADLADVTNVNVSRSPDDSSHGWYIRLLGIEIDKNGNIINYRGSEKSFTDPTVAYGELYFTTTVSNPDDICADIYSNLYRVDYTTGLQNLVDLYDNPVKKVRIGAGIATAPIVRGDVIQIGITGKSTPEDEATIAKLGGKRQGNLITLPLGKKDGIGVEMVWWKEL